jgi:hypothetical protein
MAYKYCTATNWGKNFFTHEERKQFHLTQAEAQAIVTGEIEAAQAAYDALSAEEQALQTRPAIYNLP